jgi:aminodeoxyfutalosine synthase
MASRCSSRPTSRGRRHGRRGQPRQVTATGDLRANQHINPTNICTLRKTCVFCGYARLPKEEGAYRYTLDQVLAESDRANGTMTREFHIVGGLDMQAGLEYYTTMFRALKERHPQVHIKALTAVEIAHIARIEKISWAEVLTALREAGLDTLPGGGAETFSAAVREEIADKKLGGADYIGVHRTAHQLGIRSNCTMLYGHVETYRRPHGAPADAARPAGRDRRLPRVHPAGVPPRRQRAGRTLNRRARTSGVDDLATSPSGGCSSTTSRTSSRTGSW